MGKSICILLFVWLLCLSCEEEQSTCLEPKTVSLRIGCYTMPDTGTVAVDTALPNPIIGGLFADSLKYWIVGEDNLQAFPILLSPESDTCQWVIQTDSLQTIPDTLTFVYTRRLQFLSNTCGYTYFFSLHKVLTTRNSIDSVVINNAEVSRDANTEHVRLYF